MNNFFQYLFDHYPVKTVRTLQILPGLIAMALITLPLWGSFLFPTFVAYFILLYDVYWLYKSISLSITATKAHNLLQKSEKENWLEKAESLPDYSKMKHVIVIPNYKEGYSKIKKTLDHLSEQTVSLKTLYVVLALEEREGEDAKERGQKLKKEFGNIFAGMYTTYHPDIEGEVKGKSSNQAYAIKWFVENVLEKYKLDIDYFTVSSVDADTMFDKQFFANLSFAFLTDPNRYRRFWQSALVYYNNIYDVPAPIRILSSIGSVWRTSVLIRQERLISSSTYSLSLKMLKEIGYWDTDVVPEDYRVFFKAFYKLHGTVSVAPIFLQTSLDAAQSTSYFKSLVNKYEQEKRWAWGISDDPLFIKWWLTVPGISFTTKTEYLVRVISDHFLWPVNWFIITLGANIIPLVNPVFSRTALGYSLPRLSSFVLTSCLIGLITIIIIDFRQRPKRPEHFPLFRLYLIPFEFLLLPIAGFFLSTLPGLVAQLKLMSGKRMEYKVTEKV